MGEYIERETIKYEQWSVGPLCAPLMVVRKKTIDSIPAADVVPVVHGRWIEKTDLYDKGFYISTQIWYECSCCGMKTAWKDECFLMGVGYNFCPNCGARMDGGADNGV